MRLESPLLKTLYLKDLIVLRSPKLAGQYFEPGFSEQQALCACEVSNALN